MYLNGPKIAQAEPHRHLRCWASFSPTSWCTEALGEESPSNGMWHREPGENPSYFSWLKWQYSLPLLQQCILTLKLAFRNSDISEVCPCLQVCPGLPFFFFFFFKLSSVQDWRKFFKWCLRGTAKQEWPLHSVSPRLICFIESDMIKRLFELSPSILGLHSAF